MHDAIAPVVSIESVHADIAFRASRWGKETMESAGDTGAYLNCSFTRDEYEAFLGALTTADQFTAHEFDAVPYFEGCMPVEEAVKLRIRS
ncbi:FAD-dependent oxidoreductase [Gemmatimonas sp.]|uniref:FAD-dependent oxidoreductase n=1 Tax=Gemmatimonas sp. TaxID=1962908 RepID=UPI003F715C12